MTQKYKIKEEECCSFDAIHEIEDNLALVTEEFDILKQKRDQFVEDKEKIMSSLENKLGNLSKHVP